eukprot:UN03418
MATYDMTLLDESERVRVKIQVINDKLSINDVNMLSILPDFNVAELKFEIEKSLSIPQTHQQTLILRLAETADSKELSVELSSDDMKLSEYNIRQGTVIELQLSDDSDWSAIQIAIDNDNATKPGHGVTVDHEPNPVQARTTQTDEIIRLLTKQSKIQCRILIIVFEITLVLLVAYWGTTSMIQYGINMIFILVAWRGCRKLKPFFIVCFGLYMVMDLIIIFLLIILGIAEQHESVYGSTAAY